MDPRRSINSKHKKHYIKANHVTLFKTSGKEKTLKAAKGKGKKTVNQDKNDIRIFFPEKMSMRWQWSNINQVVKKKSQPRIPCLAKRSFQKEVRKRLFSDLTTRRLTLEKHFKEGLLGKRKTIPDGNLGLHKEIKITGNINNIG